MNGLVILIPAALFLGLLGLVAFLWSLKSGQFDDLDGAAVRILGDDSAPPEDKTDRAGKAATGSHPAPAAQAPPKYRTNGDR
jgi:cbb3-type cytochrome oxidase maturation protein